MARHCGYCGSRGHNRRTCTLLTAQMNQELKDAVANRDWHLDKDTDQAATYSARAHRYAAAIARRTGTNPLTGEAAPKTSRGKRKCSYCLGLGHNRRTCEVYAKDKNIYREATRIARCDVKRRIEALGVGVGTLFVRRSHNTMKKEYSYGPRAFIIVGHKLSEYSYSSTGVHLLGMPPTNMFGDRALHGVYTTLSMLEINKRKLEEAREQGWEEDIARERAVSFAGTFEFSEDWLAAEEHTIDWAHIDMFSSGQPRLYSFINLENLEGQRHRIGPQHQTTLVHAAENLGYISQENSPS